MTEDFKNRIVLITGGSRGIGFAAAERFVERGARVALVDIVGKQAEEAAARLGADKAIGIRADVSSEADVVAVYRQVNEAFGPVDVLVTCAAILDSKTFLESSPDDWRRMWDVCLMGTALSIHAALPGMIERQHGRIICLASDSARLGQARLSYYAAAKAGVIALVKSVAQEVGTSNVTANVVSPGATDTPMRQEREAALLAQIGPQKYARRQQSVLKMYPLGRIGTPDDIAGAIAFLASGEASWITGQVLSVNGGFVMP